MIRGLFILVYLNEKSQPNHLFLITCGSNVTGIPLDGGRTTHTKHQSIYRLKECGFDDLLLGIFTASILSLRKHHGWMRLGHTPVWSRGRGLSGRTVHILLQPSYFRPMGNDACMFAKIVQETEWAEKTRKGDHESYNRPTAPCKVHLDHRQTTW